MGESWFIKPRCNARPKPSRAAGVPDSARFALHRPEFLHALERGEEKIGVLMRVDTFSCAAGETLIAANTQHDYVYRLREGWVGRTRQLEDGRNQFILIFLPGDLFAVKSMFMICHVDSVQTLSPIVAERIHYRTLHDAYVGDSEVASRCIWQVMEEERRLHSWVTGLGQGSAEERLALLLMDFRGRLVLSGTIGADALSYPMPLRQTQLADHLGITPVHMNRVLKAFRENNIVTVRDGCVTITDLGALARCASPLLDAHERRTPEYGAGATTKGSGL
jgi:CRP/FNR family transcriptional regulator, anaerobic regulatory protein